MSGERREHRIRGVDRDGRDSYVTVTTDADGMSIHAPAPVRLDRLGATRLASAVGEGQWYLMTRTWPP